MRKGILLVAAEFIFAAVFCTSCSKKAETFAEKRLVIWTDNSEITPYIELFNESHKQKAVIVYKSSISEHLPPPKDELQPDLIVGSWLRNSKISKNFISLNFLFDRKYLVSSDFYSVLLKSGISRHSQYLIPVNFNIPAIIFAKENKKYAENDYTISLEQLRKSGAEFNKKNKKGSYTAIGFAPQSNQDFLYTVSKMLGADFQESRTNFFSWNKDALNESVNILKEWITTENTSSQIENDFVYKYLSVTDDKKVTSGRTLFTYTTSDKLFSMNAQDLAKIDFRWLTENGIVTVEDSMIMMGISKKTEQLALAADFISWFFSTETQHSFLERKNTMQLDTSKFGIIGGFSTLKEVNEQVLPVYYTTLLSNIPQADSFFVTSKKPANWERIKSRVILPYLTETVADIPGKTVSTMEERIAELKKLGF